MDLEDINKLALSIQLNKKETVIIIYLLLSWKKLSLEDKNIPTDLTFNNFYLNVTNESRFMSENIVDSFKQVVHNLVFIKIFEIFEMDFNFLNIISVKDFWRILDFVVSVDEPLAVNEAFDSKIDFSIPAHTQLVEFATKLLTLDCDSVYTPFNKSYNVAYFTNAKVYAEAINREELFIVELIKILDAKNIVFKNTDILKQPSYLEGNELKKFDCVVSFPPFSMRKDTEFFYHDMYNRFKIQKGNLLDVPFFEHILAQTKKEAVVLVSVGLTYRSGAEELLRKYIIDNNWLEAIIQLPPNLHSATSIETTFFLINKNKKNDKVYFLNLKDNFFLTKDKRKIILNDIDKIVDIYKTKQLNEKYSALISIDEIIKNRYSLAIDRYVVSQEIIKIKEKIESYELATLEDIATIKKSQLFKDESKGKEVYILSPSDFSTAGYTYMGRKKIYIDEQYKKYNTYKLETNDILLSTKGTIGKVAIVGELDNLLLASQAIEIIRLKDKNRAIELYMFLKSNIGQALLNQLVSGTAMPQISTKELRKLKVPYLSLQERGKILNNFKQEQNMFDEIQTIQRKIKKLHKSFLEDWE